MALSNLTQAPSHATYLAAQAAHKANPTRQNAEAVVAAKKKCLEEMDWPKSAIDMLETR